jgi:hypothetical protein
MLRRQTRKLRAWLGADPVVAHARQQLLRRGGCGPTSTLLRKGVPTAYADGYHGITGAAEVAIDPCTDEHSASAARRRLRLSRQLPRTELLLDFLRASPTLHPFSRAASAPSGYIK